METKGVVVHTDGGARGNPGPAACAFIIEENGATLSKQSKYLGNVTNNVAEYEGVVLALGWIENNLKDFSGETIAFLLDSELIVRQLNGIYKVKDENLKKLHLKILSSIKRLGLKISFKSVPRTQNKIADLLVNQELDGVLGKNSG